MLHKHLQNKWMNINYSNVHSFVLLFLPRKMLQVSRRAVQLWVSEKMDAKVWERCRDFIGQKQWPQNTLCGQRPRLLVMYCLLAWWPERLLCHNDESFDFRIRKHIGMLMPSHWICWRAAAKSLQLCPTLCDPMDCSLPGFSVHGIHQARTLEWVAISFSLAEGLTRFQFPLWDYALSHREQDVCGLSEAHMKHSRHQPDKQTLNIHTFAGAACACQHPASSREARPGHVSL